MDYPLNYYISTMVGATLGIMKWKIVDNEKAKEKAAEYTTNILEWLHNDLTKYLKLSQDFILFFFLLGEVKCSIESNNTIDDPFDTKVTFEWEQLADAIRGGGE